MGQPAGVQGDLIVGSCVGHLVPLPNGAPVAAPPLPFAAPVLEGTAPSVLIAGKPALVAGAAGVNTGAPHPPLHPTDPTFVPVAQRGSVLLGSSTVLIEGRPAAATGARCQMCLTPTGTLQGSAATVVIGGGPGG